MSSASDELKTSRDLLISRFSSGQTREAFQENYTIIVDQYFRRSLQESRAGQNLLKEKGRLAFLAVGGYGRKELCIHSDIDILILFEDRIPRDAKNLVREVFYPLWDMGIDLGHGIRTVTDCLALAHADFQVLTSMMDTHFICGESTLCLLLMNLVEKKILTEKAEALRRWLEERDRMRMESFGDASYLIEPHLKEGIGGLRDYHHILWLSKAFYKLREPKDLEHTGKLSHKEFQELRKDLDFIWLVRNLLHLLSGRMNDRLTLRYQEKIAIELGFKDQRDFLAVEQFMGKLHNSMASIKSLHRTFAKSIVQKGHRRKKPSRSGSLSKGFRIRHGEIEFNSATDILSSPAMLMEIFAQSACRQASLSMDARRLVREFLFLVKDVLRNSQEAVSRFLDIIRRENALDALDQMYETGFLEAFIPEFELIRDRVQFDTYHIYPVGRHSLETLRYLKNVSREKDLLLLDIYSEVVEPEILFLAGLFHDIGKTGKEHAQRGAFITRQIMNRFQYDAFSADQILFLVKNHLLLVETATRRDLQDEKAVVQCARAIGGVERLKMLYLLTWADSKATGPKAWNQWIANLVQELFFKVLHILERGELATPDASRIVRNTKAQVRRKLAGLMASKELDEFFDFMSPRYLLNTRPVEITRHLALLQDFREVPGGPETLPFVLEAEEKEAEQCWEVIVLAKDKPGLFSDITGVLALNNINILSARVYTWRDGTAVDIFVVTSPLDPIFPERIWNRVKSDLEDTFAGRLSLSDRLLKKGASPVFIKPRKPTRQPAVIVDNTASDFFTLLEVIAQDRLGLLYAVASTLFKLGLDIRVAKIATKGEQSTDVFYVRDLEGQKVDEPERVKQIKTALLKRLRLPEII